MLASLSMANLVGERFARLSVEQKISAAILGICGAVALVLSVAQVKTQLRSPFFVQRSVLDRSNAFFAQQQEEAQKIELHKKKSKQLDVLAEDYKKRTDSVIITPVIVTNAPLMVFDIEDRVIDSEGNLIDLPNLQEVPYLGLNVSKEMHWDNQVVKYSTSQPLITVFVVNIKHLVRFVEELDDWVKDQGNSLFQ